MVYTYDVVDTNNKEKNAINSDSSGKTKPVIDISGINNIYYF